MARAGIPGTADAAGASEGVDRRPLGTWRWMLLGALVTTAVASVDAAFGPDVVLIGLLSIGPLVTCLRGTKPATLLVAIYALGLAVVLGIPDEIMGSADHLVRIAVVGISGALAVRMADLRERAGRAAAESGRVVHSVYESALDCIISMDDYGKIVDLNPATEETFALKREDAVGRQLCDLIIPPRNREAHRAGLARLRQGGEPRILGKRLELEAMRSDGSEFPVELTVTRAATEEPLFTGFIRDITAAKQAEQERSIRQERDAFLVEAGMLLDRSLDHEATLDQIARLAVEKVCDWAFVELLQPDGSIKRVAMAHADPEREALVREYDRRYPVDPDAPAGSAKIIRTGEAELLREIPDEMLEAVAEDAEHLRILRELGFRSAMVVPLQARGRILGDLALVSAESERLYGDDDLSVARKLATRCALALDNARLYREARESEERLRHQSLHDGLTGLPNRALFLDRLELALARAERRESDPALLFCDLDGFKQVNDTNGHLLGDELLRAIPARLNGVIRAEDTLSRFGGDEFAVLCADLPEPTDVLLVAERLIAQLREPFVINGTPLQLGASIGIAFATESLGTADALLRAADAAMYEAKREGGNRYRVAHQAELGAPDPAAKADGTVASEPVGPEATGDPV